MIGWDVFTWAGLLLAVAGCAVTCAVSHDYDRRLWARWDTWRRQRADLHRVRRRP